MLNPDLKGVLSQGVSRYSLVTATAKRAREIAMTNLKEKNLSTLQKKHTSVQTVLCLTYPKLLRHSI